MQLSLQGTDGAMADWVSNYRGAFERKMRFTQWIAEAGIPLTLNVVLHRHNLHQLSEALELALAIGARRIELAMVQFHGWAIQNRRNLMPTKEQAELAKQQVIEARARLKGVLAIDFVAADYHEKYPKNCMGGWGSTGLNITPDGTVLPCHAAQTITHLNFHNVRDKALSYIWYESEAFNAYRGDGWMQEPCRSCERKHIDFGGCRCQALAITGDAKAADPVCIKSPDHQKVLEIAFDKENAQSDEFVYRKMIMQSQASDEFVK